MTSNTPQEIAKQVADRLMGVVTKFEAFGKVMTLDSRNRTVYDHEGTPVWEWEDEADFKGKTAGELGNEIEKIFWYDQDILEATQND